LTEEVRKRGDGMGSGDRWMGLNRGVGADRWAPRVRRGVEKRFLLEVRGYMRVVLELKVDESPQM
jgi:hypothetical protein